MNKYFVQNRQNILLSHLC